MQAKHRWETRDFRRIMVLLQVRTREKNKTAIKPTMATETANNVNKFAVIGTRDGIDTARTVRRYETATRNEGYLRKNIIECHVTQVAESEGSNQ